MNKTFGELITGQRFILNGSEYVKVQEIKISCCKVINCQLVNDPNNKTYINPTTMVLINA